MKNSTLILALFLLYISSHAQDENISYRPIQGNKAISFNIAGLANLALNSTNDPLTNAQMIDFRYFYSDNLAFRIGLGVTTLGTTITSVNDTSGGLPLVNAETESSTASFSIGIGVEKHVKTKSRSVDPFVGAGIYFSSLGDSTVNTNVKTTQTNNDYVDTKTETIHPGGSAFGIAINGGFFWYFAQNLALGGEISLGFATGGVGGEMEETMTSTSSVGGVVTTTSSTTRSTSDLDFGGIRTLNTGAIHLLIKF